MLLASRTAPYSQQNRFRSKRFRLFKELAERVISEKRTCRVLDVGGTPRYWQAFGDDLPWDRLTVSVLNVSSPAVNRPGLVSLVGDARSMKDFDDFSFDVVHSNSVLEHVGKWSDMASMASEIRRIAPRYFVQTAIFLVPDRAACPVSVFSLDAGVLALSNHHESNMRILEPAVRPRIGDERGPGRRSPRQTTNGIPVP